MPPNLGGIAISRHNGPRNSGHNTGLKLSLSLSLSFPVTVAQFVSYITGAISPVVIAQVSRKTYAGQWAHLQRQASQK